MSRLAAAAAAALYPGTDYSDANAGVAEEAMPLVVVTDQKVRQNSPVPLEKDSKERKTERQKEYIYIYIYSASKSS